MSLSEKIYDDKIEIIDQSIIQVRTAHVIMRDDNEVSRTYSRRVVVPSDDVSGETELVKAIAEIVFTDEVKAAFVEAIPDPVI